MEAPPRIHGDLEILRSEQQQLDREWSRVRQDTVQPRRRPAFRWLQRAEPLSGLLAEYTRQRLRVARLREAALHNREWYLVEDEGGSGQFLDRLWSWLARLGRQLTGGH
jgi:hypothetical protein